jgi:hypothetical protein
MAVGARVTITAGKLIQTGELRAGGSYLSSNDPRLHFGLGSESNITELTVRWPDGEQDVLKNLPPDFIYTIVEGQGITNKTQFSPVK